MKRHAFLRSAVAVTTVTAAVALSLGTVALSGQAYAAGTADVQIPATHTTMDPAVTLVATTFDGELFQVEGSSDYWYTDNANGATKAVTALAGVPRSSISTIYDAGDRFAYSGTDPDGSTKITLLNAETAAQTNFTVPAGDDNPVIEGGSVVATRTADDGTHEYRIIRPIDSTLSDIPVLLPAGATAEATPTVLSGTSNSFILRWQQDGTAAYGIVDAITGAVQVLPVTGEASSFVLSDSWVSWFSRQDTTGVRVMRPGSPSATPTLVPMTPQSTASDVHAFMAGSNVVWYDQSGGPLHLKPVTGADTARDIMPKVEQALPGRDGGIVAVGSDAAGNRGIYQVFVDGSGLAVADLRHKVAPTTYQGAVTGLTLDHGTVTVQNTLPNGTSRRSESVGLGLTPQSDGTIVTENVPAADLPEIPGRFADGGDEGMARLTVDPVTQHDVLRTADDSGAIALPTKGGRILDVSPKYVLYEAGDDQHRQYVVDIVQNKIVRDQDAQASALVYSTLWTSSPTTPNTLVATDLRTGATTRTLSLRCTPDVLQDNGLRLYWKCSDKQAEGVTDLTTGQEYVAWGGDVMLGENFMAEYSPESHTLYLYSLQGGFTSGGTAITGLKQTTAADTRGLTWTVDPHSNKVAWVDSNDTVHVVAPDIYNWIPAQLTCPEQSVPASFAASGADGTDTWDPQWWLSKPVKSWSLTIRNSATGAEARSFSGSTAYGSIKVAWDGKTVDGAPLPRGAYTWELLADPADGTGQSADVSGTFTMNGDTAVLGDLLGRDSSGVLWQYQTTGDAAAPYAPKTMVGGGWNTYTALTSLSGQTVDGTGDLVGRDASGILWYYRGSGKPSAPFDPRVEVGSGWNAFNMIVGDGDLTGDGRADMVARDASGTLWLYRGTGSGTFAPRTEIGTGWNAYTTLVRANDVTGDGRSDLVARDASGTLWLYRGTGNATAPYAAKTLIGTGWNTYTILAGANDVTGDGRADLVARDASGVLWLYRGTGNANTPYAARTRIGSGWNTYNALA